MPTRLAILLPVIAFTLPCLATDWPQWRGPNGQGVVSEARVADQWSETDNISWRTEIAGRGWSSPVVVGNHVWLTTAHETAATEEERAERLKSNTGSQPLTILAEVRINAVCVDKQTGKIIKEVEALRKEDPQWSHATNSYASPTPIIEAGRLYVQNGSYGTACIDIDRGKVLWTNQELWVMHENGPGGSPAIWADFLIFNMDGSDQQFIAALDKHSGKLAWQTPRSGKMNSNPQLKKSYGTPVVAEIHGRDVVVSPAANWVYGYDPATGKELWKIEYGGLGFSIVPKPVVGDGMIYIGTSYMKPKMLGIDITTPTPQIAWTHTKNVPAISSPILINDGLFFVSDKGGIVTCLHAMTGQERWRHRVGGNHSASPTYAGDLLMFHSREGETAVIKPGPKLELVHRNKLEGSHFASAAVSDDALFLRTDKALYRIEDK